MAKKTESLPLYAFMRGGEFFCPLFVYYTFINIYRRCYMISPSRTAKREGLIDLSPDSLIF